MLKLLLGGAAAVAAARYLKKNDMRPEEVLDKAKGYAKRYAGQVKGGRPPAEERLNDPALARKVESEIFRDRDVPKGNVSVNVEYGVVYLRGELPDQEIIDELVAATRVVDGVRGVESLLHLPSESPPAKDEAGHGAGGTG